MVVMLRNPTVLVSVNIQSHVSCYVIPRTDYGFVISPLWIVSSIGSIALDTLLLARNWTVSAGKSVFCVKSVFRCGKTCSHKMQLHSLLARGQDVNLLGSLRNAYILMWNVPSNSHKSHLREIQLSKSLGQALWGPRHRQSMWICQPSVAAFNKLSELANAAFRSLWQFPLLFAVDVS